MDKRLEEYMKSRYGEDYQGKAQADYEDRQDHINTGSVVSSIGAALAGRAPSGSDSYYNQLGKQAKEDTIGKIDKARDQYVKNEIDSGQMADLQDKDKIRTAENDPTNPQALAYASELEKFGVKIPSGLSVAEMKRNYGDAKSFKEIQMRAQIDFDKQKELRKMDESFKSREKGLDRSHDLDKALAKKEIEDLKKKDPKNLNSSDKVRFDNAMMVLNGLNNMASALDNGDNTFSLIGDNDYTAASRAATEGYGRMQSGGAINKEEEARFDATLPRKTDNKEIQRKKLIAQRDLMIGRLKTLGFSPEDVGYKAKEFQYGMSPSEKSQSSMVSVRAPDGQIRSIPQDKVQAALNAGGQLLEMKAGF